jgi:hypothetical protein
MQAAAPVRPAAAGFSAAPFSAARRQRVSGALRAVESLLLAGGQRTARHNAWSAVLEDRRRAKDRAEAQSVLDAVSAPSSRAT